MKKFKKLKVDWLKNPVTASNYKKARKEFDTIPIKATDDLTADDVEWRGICDHVNEYVMELKIFKHLLDTKWSKYEASTPAWMNDGGPGAYP